MDERIADIGGFSGARLARIDNFFSVEVSRGLIPGAVLLIERGGETVMKRAWGHRNRAAGLPMTTDTIFRIYSMTKPMVSVATMMLAGEGRLHLAQPVSDFIPSFANLKVLEGGRLVEPRRPPSLHDLLRHTAGLIYERNGGPVAQLYRQANVLSSDLTNEEFADRIATVPLAHQPGSIWDYSHATDVLGRVVEVVAGRSLGAVLRSRLLEPLGMRDTGFSLASDADHGRLAEPLVGDTIAYGVPLFDPRRDRTFEAGGMGLVSTLDDYAAFCRMLLGDGTADGRIYLGRHSLRFMTADHVGPDTGIALSQDFLAGPGYGFGLGFAVRRELGASPFPGSIGEFNWSGIAGTFFWIDPVEDLFVVLLTQAPRQRQRYRAVIKALVYDALVGKKSLKSNRRHRKAAAHKGSL